MKRILIGIGIVLIIAALVSIGQYVGDYEQLSEYGKGFIWGKVLILLLGVAMLFFASRKKQVN